MRQLVVIVLPMLGSLQGAFKVTTLHFSGFGLVHDSFASLLIPLTLVLCIYASGKLPFKRIIV